MVTKFVRQPLVYAKRSPWTDPALMKHGLRNQKLVGLAIILLTLSRPRIKALLLRRPSIGHLAELVIYLSSRSCGLVLQALHCLAIPFNRIPFLFKIRSFLLLGFLRALKKIVPSAHSFLMDPPALNPMNTTSEERKTTAGSQKIQAKEDAEVDVSFIGCSWLMIYHIGVSSTLLDAGVIKPGHTVVGGSSSGSLVAAALASGVDLNQLKKLIVDMSLDSHQRILGPLGLMSYYVSNGLQSLLPRDALQRIKHTLRVVVSRVGDHAHNDEEEQQQEEQEDDVRVIAEKETEGAETFSLLAMDKSGKRKIGLGIGLQREICDHFESRDNLIDTLLSSCFIPGYYERPPVCFSKSGMKTSLGIDGGLSYNLLPAKITVSPYPGTAIICPDSTESFPGFYSLFPPKQDELERIYRAGQRDAEAYLSKTAAAKKNESYTKGGVSSRRAA